MSRQNRSERDARYAGGRGEVLDPTPVERTIPVRAGEGLEALVRGIFRSEQLRREALAEGKETPEEADDFDCGEDYEPPTPYELVAENGGPTPDLIYKQKLQDLGNAVGSSVVKSLTEEYHLEPREPQDDNPSPRQAEERGGPVPAKAPAKPGAGRGSLPPGKSKK